MHRAPDPRASYVSDHVISLPMHMRLTYDDVRYICDEVIKIAKEQAQSANQKNA